jgi:hypothetical protein
VACSGRRRFFAVDDEVMRQLGEAQIEQAFAGALGADCQSTAATANEPVLRDR